MSLILVSFGQQYFLGTRTPTQLVFSFVTPMNSLIEDALSCLTDALRSSLRPDLSYQGFFESGMRYRFSCEKSQVSFYVPGLV